MNNIEQIKQFKELLDEGIITQEEFDKKKADLLGIEIIAEKSAEASEPIVSTEENIGVAVTSDVAASESDKLNIEKETLVSEESLGGDAESQQNVEGDTDNTESTEIQADNISIGGIFKAIPKPVMIGIAAVLLIIIIAFASGTGSGGGGIKGSWHCTKVAYLGTELVANTEEQQNDYTVTFKNGKFDMSIYGEQISGTWERASDDEKLGGGGTLPTGTEVQIYTLNAGNPLMAVYYVEDDMLIIFLGSSVDENNYIMYERD